MILETLPARDTAFNAVIAIHGYTGDEHALRPFVIGIRSHHTSWYFPRAPYADRKGRGYTWFQGNDKDGWTYEESFDLLTELIQHLRDEGFEYEQIYLLGFSQGACLSMDFMIRQNYRLGGIFPIAGFVKFPDHFIRDATLASRSTPVHLFHGQNDDIVPVAAGEQARDLFQNLGYDIRLTTYPAGHKIPVSVARLIRDVLQA